MNEGRQTRRHGLLLLFALMLAGCCCSLDFELDPSLLPRPLRQGKARKPRPHSVETPVTRQKASSIGQARYPASNSEKLTHHSFRSSRTRSTLQLSYGLSRQAEKHILKSFRDFANRVGYLRLPGGNFRWRPPAQCRGTKRCIFDALAKQNEASIEPLTRLFRQHAGRQKLNANDAAKLVVRFVQAITYRIPKQEPFGLLAPSVVVSRSWGDCDSKALLAHMILQGLGLRTVILRSKAHRHAMLGLAMPAASGHYFRYQGSRFAYVETTARGAPIGYIKRKLLHPNDWRVIPMQHVVKRRAPNAS
jgi:hypothetical protein